MKNGDCSQHCPDHHKEVQSSQPVDVNALGQEGVVETLHLEVEHHHPVSADVKHCYGSGHEENSSLDHKFD